MGNFPAAVVTYTRFSSAHWTGTKIKTRRFVLVTLFSSSRFKYTAKCEQEHDETQKYIMSRRGKICAMLCRYHNSWKEGKTFIATRKVKLFTSRAHMLSTRGFHGSSLKRITLWKEWTHVVVKILRKWVIHTAVYDVNVNWYHEAALEQPNITCHSRIFSLHLLRSCTWESEQKKNNSVPKT